MKKPPPPKTAAITIQLHPKEKDLIKQAAKLDNEQPANWAKMILCLAAKVRVNEHKKREGEPKQ